MTVGKDEGVQLGASVGSIIGHEVGYTDCIAADVGSVVGMVDGYFVKLSFPDDGKDVGLISVGKRVAATSVG